jgi:hypothetical protein
MSKEEFAGFLRGNAIKYLARCNDKGGVEDLRKARHYIDKLIELEIRAKGLTAPRVTPADIEANIASERYFTAAQGVVGSAVCAEDEDSVPMLTTDSPLHLLTFCVLVLKNGFTVTGESACASPENFDAAIGRKIARQNAVNKVWPLMGYELRSKLAAQGV